MPKDETNFFDIEREALDALTRTFERALELRQEGDDKGAEKALRGILGIEPRLAEPRLELGHMFLLRGQYDEAEEMVRMAIDTLRSGGRWNLDLPIHKLLSFAANLLGEILSASVVDTDLILVDRAGFVKIWNEAAKTFRIARELDPDNQDAVNNANNHQPMPVDASRCQSMPVDD